MAKHLYGFEEAPQVFQHKIATKSSPKGHGASGMVSLLPMACQEKKDFKTASDWVTPGSIQSTFGRLHMAAEGTPHPEDKFNEALLKLANAMLEDEDTAEDGPADAGIAFLGQFIDHDITLEATTELGKTFEGSVSDLRNFRTPKLDLDCVYGDGPEVDPHLYDRDVEGKLLFGRHAGEGHDESNHNDMARNRQGRALIGDPRNDENLFVSQVHGRRFIAEHNKLIDNGMDFKEARSTLTKRYHEEIVNTFLPAVIDPDVLKPFLDWLKGGGAPQTGAINWGHVPDMPIEFAAAAFRFGHSMIRETYTLNDDETDVPIFNAQLGAFGPVEEKHNLDFKYFFDNSSQKARPIDVHLPKALLTLPESIVGHGGERNLAFRNMQRGQITFQLPSGEQMASHLGFNPIKTHPFVEKAGLEGCTPLWFYILAEAEKKGGLLGHVGGSIVAGVIVNLLKRGNSHLSKPSPYA